jgi:hypothetical protein
MTVTLAEGDGGAVDVFWEKDSAGKRVIGADIFMCLALMLLYRFGKLIHTFKAGIYLYLKALLLKPWQS